MKIDTELPPNFNLQKEMSIIAMTYINIAMARTNGNKTKAAKLLGLPSYQTLTNWIEKYSKRD